MTAQTAQFMVDIQLKHPTNSESTKLMGGDKWSWTKESNNMWGDINQQLKKRQDATGCKCRLLVMFRSEEFNSSGFLVPKFNTRWCPIVSKVLWEKLDKLKLGFLLVRANKIRLWCVVNQKTNNVGGTTWYHLNPFLPFSSRNRPLLA